MLLLFAGIFNEAEAVTFFIEMFLKRKIQVILVLIIWAQSSWSTPDTVLHAETVGEYQARLVWNRNRFDCNNMESFQFLIKRDVIAECKRNYVSHDPNLLDACRIGAERVLTEKENSCHQSVCQNSGDVLGEVVTSISCHYTSPSWSVTIPKSCMQVAISSCLEKAVPNIEERIDHNECNGLTLSAGFFNKVGYLCESLVNAFVSG